ncbi:unnamed protein product [Meloidogyne enterolobii]|uniref:Uncharacterized protein n=1 Tax=Meloidogyne enterolobii TaxID=390850 RepID=A0ACB0ZKU0_MELEN
MKKIDEIEHRANILEKALQEQEEIRTKSEERIEAISITQEHNKKQLKNKIKKQESFWKYLTNFFSSACNVENKESETTQNNEESKSKDVLKKEIKDKE